MKKDIDSRVKSLEELFQGLKEKEIKEVFEEFLFRRDIRIDIADNFGVSIEEIATIPDHITSKTRLWYGNIVQCDGEYVLSGYKDLFNKLPKDVRVVVSVDKEREKIKLDAEGKSTVKLLQDMEDNGGEYSNDFKKMIDRGKINITSRGEINAIVLSIKDLMLSKNTFNNIQDRSKELGLKDCPPDFAMMVVSSSKYAKRLIGKYLFKMDTLVDSTGDQYVFDVLHTVRGNYLDTRMITEDFEYDPNDKIVFQTPIPL